jgi:hypothetical protein
MMGQGTNVLHGKVAVFIKSVLISVNGCYTSFHLGKAAM